MLWGHFASRASEARYPQLWAGRVFGLCPSVQGPAGLNLYDLSGRGRHATLNNMDPPTDWVRNQGLYSLDLDGTADNVSFPTITFTGPFSLSLWCLKRTNGSLNEREVFGHATDANVFVGFTSTTTLVSGSSSGTKTFSGSIGNNTINHVVATRDGGNTARVYINGKESSTGGLSMTGNLPMNLLGQYLNGTGGNAPYSWDGWIDDVAFYNRALTPGEIRLLATRRGIAYEARRDIVFGSTANRLRRIICGGNC